MSYSMIRQVIYFLSILCRRDHELSFLLLLLLLLFSSFFHIEVPDICPFLFPRDLSF